MPDYEKLYHLMVNASEDAIAALKRGNTQEALETLITAERQAEELYITARD